MITEIAKEHGVSINRENIIATALARLVNYAIRPLHNIFLLDILPFLNGAYIPFANIFSTVTTTAFYTWKFGCFVDSKLTTVTMTMWSLTLTAPVIKDIFQISGRSEFTRFCDDISLSSLILEIRNGFK